MSCGEDKSKVSGQLASISICKYNYSSPPFRIQQFGDHSVDHFKKKKKENIYMVCSCIMNPVNLDLLHYNTCNIEIYFTYIHF